MNQAKHVVSLLQERFGLLPRRRCDEQFRRALARTANAKGLTEAQILERVSLDPSLLSGLVGAFTVGESYFFRHAHHFDVLVGAARRVLANACKTLSIWSAGCANGEEPYSIALALRDALTSTELARVSIVATDINSEAVKRAEMGVFPRWSFREVAPRWLARYFREVSMDQQELRREVCRQVAFRHAALQEHLLMVPQASLDMIFFRNVSVYLTESAVEQIYRGFAATLRPGGLLFVSPTDVRPQLAAFRAYSEQDTTIFERHSAVRSEPCHHGSTITGARHPERAAGSSEQLLQSNSELASIDDLANRGDLSAALALASTCLQRQGPAAELYHRRGSLHFALGNVQAAIDDYRRTVYMAPDDHVTRYWYALALRQAGEADMARRQLAIIQAAQPAVPDDLRHSVEHLMGELACR